MAHKFTSRTASALLAVAILSLPFGAYAEEDKKAAKAEVRVEKSEQSCLKAFGHLVAPGWLRVKGETSGEVRCDLPFGINKKFGGKGTTTPDTTAPVTTAVTATADATSAIVSWKTDERTKSAIFFGTASPLNIESTSTARVHEGRLFAKDEHRVVLRGLSASTTYYLVIKAEDKAGNTSHSTQITFTTKAPITVRDTVSPIISSVVTVAGNASVGIDWKTNEPSTSKVYYSASAPVQIAATTTASAGSSGLTNVHFVLIPNLSANTKYYFVAESKDAANNAQITSEFSGTTLLGL